MITNSDAEPRCSKPPAGLLSAKILPVPTVDAHLANGLMSEVTCRCRRGCLSLLMTITGRLPMPQRRVSAWHPAHTERKQSKS